MTIKEVFSKIIKEELDLIDEKVLEKLKGYEIITNTAYIIDFDFKTKLFTLVDRDGETHENFDIFMLPEEITKKFIFKVLKIYNENK